LWRNLPDLTTHGQIGERTGDSIRERSGEDHRVGRDSFPVLLAAMLVIAAIMSAAWHFFSDDDEGDDRIVRFDMRIEFEGFHPGGEYSENTTVWHFSGEEFEIFSYPTPGTADENGTGKAIWLFSNVTMKRTSVLEAMHSLARRCGFSISDKEYESMGAVLVTGIGGVENNQDGSGAYWVYRVNGDYAVKSADQQKIEDGMLIKWKFEKY